VLAGACVVLIVYSLYIDSGVVSVAMQLPGKDGPQVLHRVWNRSQEIALLTYAPSLSDVPRCDDILSL